MGGWRWAVAVGIVAAMAGMLVVALINGSEQPAPLTMALTTTTRPPSTTLALTTTTVQPTTSTTTEGQRLAEVTEMARQQWFGYFDAIYRKDEAALWKVVATKGLYEDGLFGMQSEESGVFFTDEPTLDGVVIDSLEILLDRQDCLVVFQAVDLSAFRPAGTTFETVSVYWSDPRYGWRKATAWRYPGDLWLSDCNAPREQTP
jgi:hypothetical protein